MTFSLAQPDAQNPFMFLSTLPTLLPKLGQSRVPQLTAGLQSQVSEQATFVCTRGSGSVDSDLDIY